MENFAYGEIDERSFGKPTPEQGIAAPCVVSC